MADVLDIFIPTAFAGRDVLVTGGTSGIGLGAALAFRALGARVAATGATDAECDTARTQEASSGIAFMQLDVRDGPAVDALVAALPSLDVLVNAAGVIRRDLEHEPDVFAEVIAINLTGTMRVCAAARPKLAASRGCVVNVASMLTFFGGPRVPAYTASKGGIGQLTKSLAASWAGDGIRVNAVAPGWIATPLTAGAAPERGGKPPHPRAHADGPLGNARGGCGSGYFPGLASGALHHRRDPGGRWRLSRRMSRARP